MEKNKKLLRWLKFLVIVCITNGSISINGKKITDLEFMVTKEVAIEDKYIIIRRGKKKYFIIVFK